MRPLCSKCYSSQVYPLAGASLSFPESLNQTALSPSVLASIGSRICQNYQINPMIGVAVGTLIGMGFSLWQPSNRSPLGLGQNVYYCSDCQNVFKVHSVNGSYQNT